MNTPKLIYTMFNNQIRISVNELHSYAGRYARSVGVDKSRRVIRGSTSDLIKCYSYPDISWKRLLTYFRIIGGRKITVSIRSATEIAVATDDIYYPVNTNSSRLVTATQRDGEILKCLIGTYDLTDIELERIVKHNILKIYSDDSMKSSKVTNLVTSLTRPSISWDKFTTMLFMLGIDNAEMTVTVALVHGDVSVTTKIL